MRFGAWRSGSVVLLSLIGVACAVLGGCATPPSSESHALPPTRVTTPAAPPALAATSAATPPRSAINTATVISSLVARLKATDDAVPPGRYTYFTSQDSPTGWETVEANGWTSAFLPGELWMAYRLTRDPDLADRAARRQRALAAVSTDHSLPDIGMHFYYSFAQAFDLTGNPTYRDIALRGASGQAKRFVGSTKTFWSEAAAPGDQTHVVTTIIDEVMNNQILYWAAEKGGPDQAPLKRMALEHASTVAGDFVRADGSVYQKVQYDARTGRVLAKLPGQGYSKDSAWSRGQAWAMHGFTTAYGKSGDPNMLDAARRVSDFYLKNVPPDMVPYWDFRAPGIPNAPKDSSAAAIASSALFDLARLETDPARKSRYEAAAKATLESLLSPAYLSSGQSPALLLHGTMNWRTPRTIDVGQSFGDYFLLEALSKSGSVAR